MRGGGGRGFMSLFHVMGLMFDIWVKAVCGLMEWLVRDVPSGGSSWGTEWLYVAVERS